jgi:hypothetical protein
MRKIALIALTFFLLAALAAAQVPTSGNVFVGYSFYSTKLSGSISPAIDRANINGWQASLEGKVFPFLGIVADFDGHYGSELFGIPACPVFAEPCTFNASVSEHNVLFGPRFSASVGKFRPFAEFEVGVGHVNANAAGSDTSFATAFGGGLDYRLIRVIAWRLQGDYVQTRFFGTTQNNVRVSTGIVLRF